MARLRYTLHYELDFDIKILTNQVFLNNSLKDLAHGHESNYTVVLFVEHQTKKKHIKDLLSIYIFALSYEPLNCGIISFSL